MEFDDLCVCLSLQGIDKDMFFARLGSHLRFSRITKICCEISFFFLSFCIVKYPFHWGFLPLRTVIIMMMMMLLFLVYFNFLGRVNVCYHGRKKSCVVSRCFCFLE